MDDNHTESESIRQRMRELRFAGLKDVRQLHAQASRATDWREHVRAQPVATVIAASVVGFTVVRAFAGRGEAQQVVITQSGAVKPQKSASMGLLSIAGGMAASLARQWLTEYVKNQVGVRVHATNQSVDANQRSHAKV